MTPKPRAKRPKAGPKPASPLADDLSFDAIRALAASLNDLHRQMAAASAPIVQSIIHSRSRDVQEIERALDRLLDCACIPEGLAHFKTLCRYYYPINPAATASYVHAYREMWDTDASQPQEIAS